MDLKDYSKYFLLILFVGTLGLSIWIIKDFLVPVLSGLIVGYIFLPVYVKIKEKLKNENWSALLLSIMLILLFLIPSLFVLNALVTEASTTYLIAKQKITTQSLFSCDDNPDLFCRTMDFFLSDSASKKKFIYYLDQTIQGGATFIIEYTTGFIFSLPGKVLDMFIALFVMFYMFVDSNRFFNAAKQLIPIKQRHRERLLKQFSDVTYALVYGTILVGLIEGAIIGIGFFFSDISSPILWGILTSFVALIPILGPTLIWGPTVLVQFYTGNIWSAIGVLITGIIVSSIDTFIRPRIIGKRANVHAVLVLLGVLGGVKIFGLVGVIFGPLVLAFISTFIHIYEKEIEEEGAK